MFHEIGKWLAPPQSSDEEHKRTAALLDAILAGIAIWMGIGLLVNFIIGTLNQANGIVGLVSIGLIFILRRIGQTGRIRLATLLTSTFIVLLTTLAIYNLGTIRTILLGYYLVAFIIPTLLIGPRTGLLFAGLVTLITLALMVLENAGMLPDIAPPPLSNQVIVFAEVVLIILVIPYLARRTMLGALEQARGELMERKRAEEAMRLSEGRLNLFLHHFQGIAYQVSVVDANVFKTVFMRGTLQQITGYRAEDFENGTVTWERLVHPDDLALVNDENQKLLSRPGYVADGEYRIYDQSGTIHWVHDTAHVAFFEAENTKLLQGVIYDITERKRIEAELKEYREHLELLVAERAAELKSAYEQLEALSHIKDEFVSNVSHELRTPIASLKVHQHLIRERPHQLSKYLPAMQRETDRLHRTIEALLQLSQLDQGRIEPKMIPVNLSELIEQYVQDRKPLAEEKSLTLTYTGADHLPLVNADPELLGETLSILLTNAISYTPASGQIHVSTQTRQQENKTWIGFSVSDSGPGIPPDEQGHLFERFFRGRVSRQSGIPGTGLGLALAREIVGRHNGLIEYQNQPEPEHGATFSIWLATTGNDA